MNSSAINRIFRLRPVLPLAIFLLWTAAVFYIVTPLVGKYRFATLHKILKSGRLTVITRNTPHCYYIYRGQPMGFEYDLAKAFADELGVHLKVKIADSWDAMVPQIENGTAAIIAAGIAISAKRQQQLTFSDGYMEVQQQLIARRDGKKIKRLADLAGRTIHVRADTVYQERLEELKRQGIDLTIAAHDDLPTEELIQQVAQGQIELTVADSNIARLNRRHYPRAVMAGPIGEVEQLGWAVHPEARRLRAKINAFFKKIKANGRFDDIYDKYYGDIGQFDYVDLRVFHRRIKTRLSRYSPFIKAAARKHGFDWRLIAAQIYQESHLNPWAKSHAGARGLMQLLPDTAHSLGVKDIYNPVENINAGVAHLKKLYDLFDGADDKNRLMIALAAYNIGQGHIQDAQRLAAERQLNPNSWEALTKTLPLLRYRKYYKKSKYGYCRGTEPVSYIKQIMIYYDILKRQGIEYGAVQAKLGS